MYELGQTGELTLVGGVGRLFAADHYGCDRAGLGNGIEVRAWTSSTYTSG